MKQFCCGDVVKGCQAVFIGETDEEILGQVAEHARQDHGLAEVPPELEQKVRSLIQPSTESLPVV